jgi:hypothetical protein
MNRIFLITRIARLLIFVLVFFAVDHTIEVGVRAEV